MAKYFINIRVLIVKPFYEIYVKYLGETTSQQKVLFNTAVNNFEEDVADRHKCWPKHTARKCTKDPS